jgi:hypothetical protein
MAAEQSSTTRFRVTADDDQNILYSVWVEVVSQAHSPSPSSPLTTKHQLGLLMSCIGLI